jgi:hypothetical protein
MKLYQITQKYNELVDAYNQAETDEERAEVLVALNKIEDSKDEKLDACCKWLRELEVEEEAIAIEIARLQAKLYLADKKKTAFKTYIADCVGAGSKWENGLFRISWRRSEAVKVIDEMAIPAAYMTEHLSYQPDKKQIKEDLKAGATIPGAELEVRHNLIVK